MPKDYYKILGVDKGASKDEIKAAFRKLAHQYHPDKAGGNEQKFKEASEAYNVLGDDAKRQQYDTFGSGGPNGGGSYGGNYGGFQGQDFGGFDFSQFNQGGNGQNFEFDLGDIFGDFFGGGGGGGRRQRVKKGHDITVDLEITFSESVFGVEKEFSLTKPAVCNDCGGSGAKRGTEMVTCSACNGKGKIKETRRSILGNFVQERVCDKCSGAGKIPKEKCGTCHGLGTVRKPENIKVKIPADINNGETVRLTGAGEGIRDGVSGDLYINVSVKKDPLFKKEGKNILTEVNIKLSDALLGIKYPLKTLDGQIELSIPEGINNDDVLRVREKGVPMDSRHRGDLLVKIKIKMPNHLSRSARKIIEDLKNEGL
jgi:molecular chaperone DnaJ